jgi:phosphoglycolate phosphatase
MIMLTALVFDLDGTLIDSAPDLHQAVLKVLAEEGRPSITLDELKTMVGDGAPILVKRVFAHVGHDAGEKLPHLVARYLAHYESAIAVHTRLYPRVHETLGRLQAAGHRMAVCTNKAHKPSIHVLDALDLSKYFDAVIGGDATPAKKPDPRHVLAVLEKLSARPANAAMIGDGANDLIAARDAGVAVIHARYGYGITRDHDVTPDAIIDDFAAIPDAIKTIANSRRTQ